MCDDLGVVEGQLGGDRRAAGVAGDVRARHAEMVEERGGVGGVVRDAHRPRGVGAADPATLVVADQLVAVGQRRFREERQEPVGEDGADEQHRFARSDHLVLELDAVDLCDLHESSSDLLGRGLVVPPERREQDGYGGNPHGYGRRRVTPATIGRGSEACDERWRWSWPRRARA